MLKLNYSSFKGLCILLVSTFLLLIVVLTQFYNAISYLVLLVCISLSIFYINRKQITSANVLFALFYCYALGFGPVVLLYTNVSYGYDYYEVILGALVAYAWGNMLVINKKTNKRIEDSLMVQFRFSRVWVLRILFLLSLVASTLYFSQNIGYLLGGFLESGRIEAMSGNGLLLQIAQLPVLIVPMMYDLYFKGRQEKIRTVSKFELGLIVFISSGTLLISGFRTPVLTMLVCLMVLVAQKNKVSMRKMILFGVIMVILTEVLGMARSALSGKAPREFIDSFLVSRTVNCINLKYVFDTFPTKTPFQHGYTYLINLRMLLPGPDLDFTLWLKDQIGISFSGGGVTPTIIGESYLNFGMASSYVVMFLLGMSGVCINNYARKHSDTFLGVFIIWKYAQCVSGGIANVMVSILLYSIVYWGLMLFPWTLKKKNIRNIHTQEIEGTA